MMDRAETQENATERPAFIAPDVDIVECFGCHRLTPPAEIADAVDVSPDDEYYPDMKPLCRRCAQ